MSSPNSTSTHSVLKVKLEHYLKEITKLVSIYSEPDGTDPTFQHRSQYVISQFPVVETNYFAAISDPTIDDTLRDYLTEKFDNFHSALFTLKGMLAAREQQMVQPEVIHTLQNSKLPTLHLPTFSGCFTEFPNFQSLFKSMVIDDKSLSNIQRLQYLKTSLQGEALRQIQSISLVEENFDTAWEVLTQKYLDRRRISAILWQKIVQHPPVKNSYDSLNSFLTMITDSLNALASLEHNVDAWSFVILQTIIEKLDKSLVELFEMTHEEEIPSHNMLLNFLSKRCKTLGSTLDGPLEPGVKSKMSFRQNKNTCLVTSTKHSSSDSLVEYRCPECKQPAHNLYECPKFLKLNSHDRYHSAKKHKVCLTCLKPQHVTKYCKSPYKCKFCQGTHNYLLHFPRPADNTPDSNSTEEVLVDEGDSSNIPNFTGATIDHPRTSVCALLPTILLEVAGSDGRAHTARALLDTGSSCSLIDSEFARSLGLQPTPQKSLIYGASGTPVASATLSFSLRIRPSKGKSPEFIFQAYAVDKISGRLPTNSITPACWDHITGLKLADPSFGVSSEVQVLLGANVGPKMFLQGTIHGPPNTPVALRTSYGWVLTGESKLPNNSLKSHFPQSNSNSLVSLHTTIEDMLERFIESEDLPQIPPLKPEEQAAEDLFLKYANLDPQSGRFVVPLLLKELPPDIGLSYQRAKSCFLALERKFDLDPSLYAEYKLFFSHLISEQIIEPVEDIIGNSAYYMPHHGVVKQDSLSTKLRVVFNGSFKTSNGRSLNDCLFTGQKLQADIIDVISKFRLPKVILVADIERMFHQISVRPDDRDYVRLLWRSEKEEPITSYRMTRIPFGLTSSPYLAIRTIQLLAAQFNLVYPRATEALNENTYVDDILTGADDWRSAQVLQQQLVDLLAQGNFHLRKWASNDIRALENVPLEDRRVQSISLDQDDTNTLKILGLCYDATIDSFFYKFLEIVSPCTKRGILSDMARHYDPMGWLSPTIFVAKRILRSICSLKLDWDDEVIDSIRDDWIHFKRLLPKISNIIVERFIFPEDACTFEIHGFSDSSEHGYAACVYIRLIFPNDSVKVHLLMGKTRMAPIKSQSLPRLELCGARLLARLIAFVVNLYSRKIEISQIYCWTDSTIVLYWLKSHASRWQTYVANRVSEIQTLTHIDTWNHIRSEDNPADCASRGVMPDQLANHPLWWDGPSWLVLNKNRWPVPVNQQLLDLVEGVNLEEKPITRIVQTLVCATHSQTFNRGSSLLPLLDRVSCLVKLQRSTSFIFRVFQPKLVRQSLPLYITTAELRRALFFWIEQVQREVFALEFSALERSLPISSKLARYAPILSVEETFTIIRVGGRLDKTSLADSTIHPILLPQKHKLTQLIIGFYHNSFGHPGPQALQAMISRKFWILNTRSAIRTFTLKCMTCFRAKPKIIHPYMASLPVYRIQQSKVFSNTGVDFAGPIMIRSSNLRKAPQQKAYFCVFICLATKACHLEAVSNLTTDAFIASLQRFISRRGRCSDIYCDQGSNLVGADRELTRHLHSLEHRSTTAKYLAVEGINFHFNPPAAPHFGGIWEGLVKSVKSHLTRIIGSQILNFEELSTVLCMIESYLNSRPLVPLSNDPNDLEVLTPGHFLTMEPLNSIPEPYSTNKHPPKDLRKRWLLVRHIHQQFWKRWQLEYLTQLQTRQKWTKKFNNLKIDDLVLLMEEGLPPMCWRRGRVTEVHPGSDGTVRVATIRTATGVLKRPVVKLAPLPLPDSLAQ